MKTSHKELADIEEWKRRLGLFPVPLWASPSLGTEKQFILLNGTKGSFCLDLEHQTSPDKIRSIAWSSNVGHYVSLCPDALEVWRWDRAVAERYDLQSISERLDDFHDYLEKSSPDSGLSVILHGIRVFRSLRTVIGPQVEGHRALKAFLYLLACACSERQRGDINPESWGLDEEAFNSVFLIKESDWKSLVQDLRSGRPLDRLSVYVELLLRHASGLLFQEAHFEALLSGQMRFEFLSPMPAPLAKHSPAVGVHFTPPVLARTLVEECLSELEIRNGNGHLRVFDPACGSGEFLREALRQIRLHQFSGTVELIGWDVSAAACAMASFGLTWDAKNDPSVRIRLEPKDSILAADEWPSDIDLVLMNPPFLSWEGMSENQKESVRDILQEEFQKKPDLSAAFLLKAAFSLRHGGALGTILPASFFGATSTSRLRERLSARLSTRLLARHRERNHKHCRSAVRFLSTD